MEDTRQTPNTKPQTLIGIIMGSDSDLPVMQAAADILKQFDIAFELTIVSAHRTPQRMFNYAQTAKDRGLKVIVAGAGGAAHLPGMVASLTTLPVIGVPIKSSNSVDGWDSILSILQMPGGVPVATVALNGAKNAGILAAQMIGAFDEVVGKKMEAYKQQLKDEVDNKIETISSAGWPNRFDDGL
ncbi:MAG: 5-(carboxyamino)imidazole ribonucleotide mutase [Bacteroidota bacterium]